jgi:hypothetical protein
MVKLIFFWLLIKCDDGVVDIKQKEGDSEMVW